MSAERGESQAMEPSIEMGKLELNIWEKVKPDLNKFYEGLVRVNALGFLSFIDQNPRIALMFLLQSRLAFEYGVSQGVDPLALSRTVFDSFEAIAKTKSERTANQPNPGVVIPGPGGKNPTITDERMKYTGFTPDAPFSKDSGE